MALCFFFIDDKPVDFCKYLRGLFIYIYMRTVFSPTPPNDVTWFRPESLGNLKGNSAINIDLIR